MQSGLDLLTYRQSTKQLVTFLVTVIHSHFTEKTGTIINPNSLNFPPIPRIVTPWSHSTNRWELSAICKASVLETSAKNPIPFNSLLILSLYFTFGFGLGLKPHPK